MSRLLRLPGLIDIHVHFRDPGETHKEDFFTGTFAALSGGVTAVFDMPNNLEPILTLERLLEKESIVGKKAVCDFGLYFGTNGKNLQEFEKVKDRVIGLKVYLNATTGKFLIKNNKLVEDVFKSWPKDKIIVAHAEAEKIDLVVSMCQKFGSKVHITHVSTKDCLKKILKAKKQKFPITCDVAPHHLFLNIDQASRKDTFGATRTGFYKVRPPLATEEDQDFLWENIADIDCIATDHAPHTVEEKKSANPPSGMPGLEAMLPLLLNAVNEERLTIKDIIRLTNTSPQRIFGFSQGKDTFVEVDMNKDYILANSMVKSKCGWTPYIGWKVKGMIKRVYIRGIKVFEDGKILCSHGFGRNIFDL